MHCAVTKVDHYFPLIVPPNEDSQIGTRYAHNRARVHVDMPASGVEPQASGILDLAMQVKSSETLSHVEWPWRTSSPCQRYQALLAVRPDHRSGFRHRKPRPLLIDIPTL